MEERRGTQGGPAAIGRRELAVGLLLIGVFWPLDWSLPGARTAWLFFPLWFGYILAMDGLVHRRTGSSLLARDRRWFAALFPLSAAIWWLFELLNLRGRNWEYVGLEGFPPWLYFLCSSLSFSTVLPAVLVTAEWIGSFSWLRRFRSRGAGFRVDRWLPAVFFGGVAMLALFLLFPGIFFPFLWTSLVCLIDPLNAGRKRPSLLVAIGRGDWRPIVVFGLAALFCGFFWELWNSRSNPRWVYHIPFLDFWHLFAMPLPGYLGYPPFGWELFGLIHLVWKKTPLRID